jgi:chromosome segregation ATPase
MVMSDTLTSSGTNETRLVTVADLRYELERERQLTNAQFREFGAKLDAVNQSVVLLRGTVDERFGLVDQKMNDFRAETLRRSKQVDERFEQVDQKIDDFRAETLRRFEQVDKRFEQVDQRFDQVDKRFDALDLRLRSSKTLAVMSLTAAASIASVVITLLQ